MSLARRESPPSQLHLSSPYACVPVPTGVPCRIILSPSTNLMSAMGACVVVTMWVKKFQWSSCRPTTHRVGTEMGVVWHSWGDTW